MLKKYNVSLFIVLAVVLFCVQLFGSAAAVEVKGKYGELQKNSLLFTERLSDGLDTYIQPHVFVISEDGSVCKRYDIPRIDGIGPLMGDDGDGFYYTKLFRPSVSNKSFGKMRNVAYFNGGSDDDETVTPFQVFSYTGDKVNTKTLNERAVNYDSYRILWDSAALTLPSCDKDIFVNLRTPYNIIGSYQSARLDFVALDRNESGDVSMDNAFDSVYTEKIYMSYAGVGMGLGMAAGDFDNDGYKNDIAVCIFEGISTAKAWLFVYTVSYNDGKITVGLKHREAFDFGTGKYGQADNTCLNVLAGDFDGDGHDEVAVVGRYYDYMSNPDDGPSVVYICKYSPNNKSWSYAKKQIPYVSDGACRAVKADVDGDGKDEIVLIYHSVFKDGGLVLHRVYCERGSIIPKIDHYDDSIVKKDILNGVDIDVSSIGYHRVFNDKISIVAGSLTGKFGKVKLVDDIAVSFVNSSHSVVSIVPIRLDGNKNFTGFGAEKRIYDQRVFGGNARGGMLTSDFADVSFSKQDPSSDVAISSEVYVGDNWGPDIKPSEKTGGVSASSSGGCDFGCGGVMMLGLVVMLFKRH